MARKLIHVSDKSGVEIPEGEAATLKITYQDGRRQVREADLTAGEAHELAESLNARSVARRGRKPRVGA